MIIDVCISYHNCLTLLSPIMRPTYSATLFVILFPKLAFNSLTFLPYRKITAPAPPFPGLTLAPPSVFSNIPSLLYPLFHYFQKLIYKIFCFDLHCSNYTHPINFIIYFAAPSISYSYYLLTHLSILDFICFI